ncbi:hypothetical protein ACFC18_39775 [Streptomyces sp. NPDC056121]|uniref:hypothetical protein n=1 Tax=Streptomyces sp. NPDC056121 TaxID=3345718 RepID=UPI0035D779AB
MIPVDFVGPNIAQPVLQADSVLHDDPAAIAAHGFNGPYRTTKFDFILKTYASPRRQGALGS